MVSANDPIESLFNSIQIVKEVFLPLELSIQKAAKDLECCWAGPKNKGNSVELANQFSGGDKNGRVQICGVTNKTGQCKSVGEERKKGLSIKFPIKALLGKFSQNSGNGHRAEVPSSGTKERDLAKEDGSCMNCLKFAVTWSLLVNSFVQAFPAPFKAGKKRFQKTCDEDKAGLCTKKKVAGELKQRECKDQSVRTIVNEGVIHKEANNITVECFIGFFFDKLTQNLPKFDNGLQEDGQNNCDTSTKETSLSQFDHLEAVKAVFEGRKADVNGFLGNLRFARVGGVPSGVVGVASSDNEEGADGATADNSDETGGSLPQKLAGGILSIPLSNVERLRSTLSTVSLTELIELVPQLGRTSKDYPDKKKLISVQDFFRYTESEGMFFQIAG